jgi:hypothetical protein
VNVDELADKLAELACQLVARVREDDPQANQRWLHLLTTPEEREAMLYILAAAVPVDQPWSHLTAWRRTKAPEDPAVIAERRRILNESLSPAPRSLSSHRAPRAA